MPVWGLINANGEFQLPPTYSFLHYSGGPFVLCRTLDGLEGVILTDGSGVLKPTFQSVRVPANGVVAAEQDGKWGVITLEGNVLVPFEWRRIGNWHSDRAAATLDGWGFLGTDGRRVVEPNYLQANNFSENMAAVSSEIGKWHFVDEHGCVAIDERYERVGLFRNGLAYVASASFRGYIDRNGSQVIDGSGWASSNFFSDGLAYVCQIRSGKDWFGYIDVYGEWVISATLEDANPFSESFAAAKHSGRWGLINTLGDWVMEPRFDNISQMSDGLAAFRLNERWGYMSRDGRIQIPAQFASAQTFHDGLAAVAIDD